MSLFSERDAEDAALGWLEGIGWSDAYGPDIAPDAANAERADYGEVVLEARLRAALGQLNADLPDDAIDDALRRLVRPGARRWRPGTGPSIGWSLMASRWNTSTPVA